MIRRETRALFFAVLAVWLMSCSATKPEGRREITHLLRISDNPGSKRFDIELENTSGQTWCIEEGSWPNNLGFLDAHSNDVWVEADGRKYHIKERNLGFCPSSCNFRLAPGDTVRASIPYTEFSLPSSVERSTKKLVLPMWTQSCGARITPR
ncbi:hypothetical protein SAMN02800691_2259 [Luteibacter sp. UNCMF366Tsu5.1]|nr:hypothetical protein SAMN02800691_2259 [Luteibacter sp. UNCMF366Tsu5.1]